MDKGQHLRLFISKAGTKKVIALATDMTFHSSLQTEDATTKDSTDTTGMWQEFEVTARSYDIQVGALIGTGDDDANTLNDIINGISDNTVDWQLCFVTGANNRTITTPLIGGQAKITNINATGTNRQNATYTATLNGYGELSS